MKLIYLFLTMLIVSNCNDSENTNQQNYEVVYTAQTRGSFYELLIANNTLKVDDNSNTKTIELSKSQVSKLNSVLNEIKLSEIENLEAPTEKRFTDGALSASFTIKKDDAVYISSDFDHQNPPKELKELYQLLEEFSS